MDDFALTTAERALLQALNQRRVRYLVIGLGAAVLQGAPVVTQDLDLWFERLGDDALHQAARDAGGFWIAPFGIYPPGIGGEGLDRIDVVLTANGLDDFDSEYRRAIEHTVDGIEIKVLPLERIIVSKRAANRPKDLAVIPALEATLRARDASSG